MTKISLLIILALFTMPRCVKRSFSETKVIGSDEVITPSSAPVLYIPSLMCSAVVISPHQLLSAGHCVIREPNKLLLPPNQKIRLTGFSGKRHNQGLQHFETTVAAVQVHPTWNANLQALGDADAAADHPETRDLALITLADQLPITPAEIVSSSVETKVLLVGAGCRNRQSPPSGRLHSAPLSVVAIEPRKLILGTTRFTGQTVAAGGCAGDSGGGAFLASDDGQPKLSPSGIWQLISISSTLVPVVSEDEMMKAVPTVMSRVDGNEVANWMELNRSPTPRGLASDALPQTLFDLLDSIRKSHSVTAHKKMWLRGALMENDEFQEPLAPDQISAIVEALLDPQQPPRDSKSIIDELLD